MFFHAKQLQYHAKPEQPDPVFARRLQELLGGQWGEMSVMNAYLFQGWNCRGPQKYKDMILDIGTEEIAHVEMLATMIARLVERATISTQEQMAADDPAVGAIMGGMDPQDYIVAGMGAMPLDSNGNRWTAAYIVASGNLLADFRFNVTAESQGRLQACRLYEMTDDLGVRDMLGFLIARDRMHQNQWLAAIAELEQDGLDATPVPSVFPREREPEPFTYQFWNASEGTESEQGRWASGPSMDGQGEFQYVAQPQPQGEAPELPPGDPRLYGTAKNPLEEQAVGSGLVAEAAQVVGEVVHGDQQ